MWLVRVSKHRTITAYRLFTRVAVVRKLSLVLCAHLFPSVSRTFTILLDSLNCFGNVRQEACIDKLIWPQYTSTMRALLASFLDPLAQTISTGKFRTVWTHNCILNCAKADEAGEDLLKVYTLFTGKVTSCNLLMGIWWVDTVGRVARSSGRDGWNTEVIVSGVDLHLSALPSLHLRSLSALPCFNSIWCVWKGSAHWCRLLFILLDLVQKVIDFHFFGCWNRLH